jgi:NAD(P)H-hydrate epimerase
MGDEDQEVLILCGNGNNGADGLAVARLLAEMEYLVDVVVNLEGDHTPEWKQNYERLLSADPEQVNIHTSWDPESIELSPSGTVIDAMFGTGLSRPLEGIWLQMAEWANEHDNLTIAIDMPSGMYVDKPADGVVMYADLVLAFQCQRLSLLMPESESYYGDSLVFPIGLAESFLLDNEIRSFELSHYYLLPFLNTRGRFSHKGDYGHGLLIAGSVGKAGAAVLAAGGAMRSGIGLLTLHVPQRLYPIVQIGIPEVMVALDEDDDRFTGLNFEGRIAALGIGPGLGTDPKTRDGLARLLDMQLPVPMVLDADALNILALDKALLDKVPDGCILTPHPGEFDRLFGEHEDHFSRYQTAIREAVARRINIVLKGGVTIVCQPNGVSFFNVRGNPGMATAGTGDVLTGVILGLLSQGYPSDVAALMGVYLHSTSGDLAAKEIGMEALIAGDVIEFLGDAFDELRHAGMPYPPEDEDA